MPVKNCLWCGKEFNARTSRGNYHTGECYRAKERAYGRRHAKTFSIERSRASNLVWTAIFNGTLMRQPCEICGALPAVAHHDDYAAPLDVRWLCRGHHKDHHNQFGPGLNA